MEKYFTLEAENQALRINQAVVQAERDVYKKKTEELSELVASQSAMLNNIISQNLPGGMAASNPVNQPLLQFLTNLNKPNSLTISTITEPVSSSKRTVTIKNPFLQ